MNASRAKKRFGQHFLRDQTIIHRIVTALAAKHEDHVVEIGPGRGALTVELAKQLPHVDAVELDRDLLAYLPTIIPPDKLTVYPADALKFDFCRLCGPGQKLRLVGNLPYNISTPLLFRLLDQSNCVQDMLFMLQKEVVQRLAARPGGKEYGRLSVMIQYRCRVEQLFDVAPGAFSPPPKVHSAVVRLVPRTTPAVAVQDVNHFADVVRLAFSSRRKTLRNNLKGLISAERLVALDVDPTRRAETLTLEEFAKLSNDITNHAAP